MWADAFCDVVLVPGENTDGVADGNQLKAQFHLSAEPDMIAHDAVLSRVGTTLPNSSAKQEGAGLHRHMPIGVDRAWNGGGVAVDRVWGPIICGMAFGRRSTTPCWKGKFGRSEFLCSRTDGGGVDLLQRGDANPLLQLDDFGRGDTCLVRLATKRNLWRWAFGAWDRFDHRGLGQMGGGPRAVGNVRGGLV